MKCICLRCGDEFDSEERCLFDCGPEHLAVLDPHPPRPPVTLDQLAREIAEFNRRFPIGSVFDSIVFGTVTTISEPFIINCKVFVRIACGSDETILPIRPLVAFHAPE